MGKPGAAVPGRSERKSPSPVGAAPALHQTNALSFRVAQRRGTCCGCATLVASFATGWALILARAYDSVIRCAPSGSVSPKTMRRTTAQLLLLFALIGTFLPLALAATTDPPHACCLRKGTHQCHGSTPTTSDRPALRDAGCCNHDCCRAVTTAQWPNSQIGSSATFAHEIAGSVAESPSITPLAQLSTPQSTRAPPAC